MTVITMSSPCADEPYRLSNTVGRALHKLAKTLRDAVPDTELVLRNATTDQELSIIIGQQFSNSDALRWVYTQHKVMPHKLTADEREQFDEVLDQLRHLRQGAHEYHIFFDVDGVAADFDRHYFEQFGTHYMLDGMEKMWSNIDGCTLYYSRQPVYPYFDELFEAIAHLNPKFLTSCRTEHHVKCKRFWANKEFDAGESLLPVLPNRHGVFDKTIHFHRDSVLIDDYEHNVQAWQGLGADAISHHCVVETATRLLHLLKDRHYE